MPHIQASDLRSLESFALRWRWADARWSKLPAEQLAQIQPLNEDKAYELCQYSLRFLNQFGLIAPLFAEVSKIDASVDVAKVQRWLLDHNLDVAQNVVVSWNDELAVLVKWQVFCEYWDDFCYPASDDVAILPLNEGWMLIYMHHEEFVFGRSSGERGGAT